MAERAKNVYRANVSYASIPKRSGHWLDRLPGIDSDVAAMKTKIQLNKVETLSLRAALEEMNAIAGILPSTVPVKCLQTPPEKITPGSALAFKLVVSGLSSGEGIKSAHSVRLRYRHVNQAGRWNVLDLDYENGVYAAAIPREYTESDFALEYYF